MTNKKLWLGMLALALMFGMTVVGCGEDDGSGDLPNTNWWPWVSTQADGNYVSTAIVSITPSSNDFACDVTVTGSANASDYYWATQVGYNYTATVGKRYRVSWKWVANDNPFNNVTVRYAQQKDYENDNLFEFGTDTNKLTIPTSEETKIYEFTMPGNCFMNFVFKVGGDIGSFKISNFKIEEVTSVLTYDYAKEK